MPADALTLFGTEIPLDTSLILLWSVVFVAGILRGFTGFGSALLIVPVLSLLYGPAAAVVIETLIEIPVVLALLPTAIRQSQHKTTLPMLAMFALFVPVGALLLSVINPEPMKIALSLFVLIMLAILTQQRRLAAFLNPKTLLAAGALAGMSQGLTAIASPIFATAMMARGDNTQTTRANIISLAGGLIILSVLSFWIIGILTPQTLAIATIAFPALIAGVALGSSLFARAAHLNLRPFFLSLISLTALATLFTSLT